MDEVPSSKLSLDEVSASKLSPLHENIGYVTDEVAEDHAENKGDENKGTDESNDRVAAFTRIETEKRLALIRAWEDIKKTKAENKAYKKLSAIGAQENTKRALVEVQLKQIEEEIEKEKAEKVEKIKNKIAMLHQQAEEKRAAIEAKRGEDILKAEAAGAKHRKNGTIPTKFRRCFWC